MSSSYIRSGLSDTARLTRVLEKIETLYAQKKSRLVLEIEGKRYRGQDLVSLTLAPADETNTIEAEIVTAEAVVAKLQVQDILYAAQAAGADGNDTTIAYVDDGTAGSETVDVTGTDIVVHMEAGESTAAQIKAAIEASAPAAALVSANVTGDESAAQVAAAEAPLADGADVATGTVYFDMADIYAISRLRTKKYRIRIKAGADDAEAL